MQQMKATATGHTPDVDSDNTTKMESIIEGEWLEAELTHGLRVWQVIFLSCSCLLSIIIMLCCCFRFRIPRTKQEIEADYQRRKIARKFRQRLACIQNSDMDDMDLRKALDRIRADFTQDSDRYNADDNKKLLEHNEVATDASINAVYNGRT